MDSKDLSIVAALAKSVGGGGGSTPIPTPTSQDVGKVIKVDDNGAYGLAIDEGQNTFAGLTDTTITSPENGQVPMFDSSDNKWKNSAVPTELPSVTSTDEGNNLIVSNGAWSKVRYVKVGTVSENNGEYTVSFSSTFNPSSKFNHIYYLQYSWNSANRLFLTNTCSVDDPLCVFEGFVGIGGLYSRVAKMSIGVRYSSSSPTIKWVIVENITFELTGTLTAGQTSITLTTTRTDVENQQYKIQPDSTIQVFTDTGINYTAISVTPATLGGNGSVTITYPAQQADVNVKVRVS